MFSTVIRHSAEAAARAPVVFVQYLASLAIVEGIKSYDMGYRELPIKLKWPNDICKAFVVVSPVGQPADRRYAPDAEDPNKPGQKSYVKMAGILVNSSFYVNEFLLVVGVLTFSLHDPLNNTPSALFHIIPHPSPHKHLKLTNPFTALFQ